MGSTIEGATEQVRWVCDGCGRSMLRSSIKRHLSWCPKSAAAKRCPTCVHDHHDPVCAAGIDRGALMELEGWITMCVPSPCQLWEARNG